MPLHTKIWASLLAGLVAGLLTWTLTTASGPYHVLPDDAGATLHGTLLGLAMGLLLGIVESLAADAPRHKALALALGCLGGAAGGALGQTAGPLIYNAVLNSSSAHSMASGGRRLLLQVAGAAGWGTIGLAVGAALGWARRAAGLAWQGALGGLLGGLLGGVLADGAVLALETTLPIGYDENLVGLMLIGGLIGLGIALAQQAGRPAWVRVTQDGRGAREHSLARPVLSIGSAETCDIVLRGDRSIAPIHVLIEAMSGHKHHLRVLAKTVDGDAPMVINERPLIGDQWLADGDQLQIGRYTLSYHEQATRGALRLGPPQPQVWTQATGAWQMTEMIAARPARGIAQPPAPAPALHMLGLSRDMAALEPSPEDAPPGLAAPLPGAALRGEGGPYVGRAFWIGPVPAITLGRAAERDISLPLDTTVSRLHARIVFEGGHHVLIDAGSANGTYVNGQRLQAPRPLRPGDILSLGATTLRYG